LAGGLATAPPRDSGWAAGVGGWGVGALDASVEKIIFRSVAVLAGSYHNNS